MPNMVYTSHLHIFDYFCSIPSTLLTVLVEYAIITSNGMTKAKRKE